MSRHKKAHTLADTELE